MQAPNKSENLPSAALLARVPAPRHRLWFLQLQHSQIVYLLSFTAVTISSSSPSIEGSCHTASLTGPDFPWEAGWNLSGGSRLSGGCALAPPTVSSRGFHGVPGNRTILGCLWWNISFASLGHLREAEGLPTGLKSYLDTAWDGAVGVWRKQSEECWELSAGSRASQCRITPQTEERHRGAPGTSGVWSAMARP